MYSDCVCQTTGEVQCMSYICWPFMFLHLGAESV